LEGLASSAGRSQVYKEGFYQHDCEASHDVLVRLSASAESDKFHQNCRDLFQYFLALVDVAAELGQYQEGGADVAYFFEICMAHLAKLSNLHNMLGL
jgi:hypothetical protein